MKYVCCGVFNIQHIDLAYYSEEPPRKKEVDFDALSPEEQEDFLNDMRDAIRIENEFWAESTSRYMGSR